MMSPRGVRVSMTRRMFVAVAAGAGLGVAAWRPVAGQTPVADVDVSDPFVERIGALLGMAPATEITPDNLIPFYFADIAAQMETVGVELPDASQPIDDMPPGFSAASIALPLAAQAFALGLDDEWFTTFGFSPLGVHRALTLNDPPDTVSIFSGGIDGATVEAALEASGYQPVLQETGGMYWTFGDDISPTNPVGRLGVGSMNQAAVYGDTAVFTRQEAMLQTVTQIVAGLAPSMLEQGLWSSMVALFPGDTVGLVPMSPAIFDGILPPDMMATPIPSVSPGRIEYLAFGVRAGGMSEPLSLVGEGTPEATPSAEAVGMPSQVELRLRYADPAIAEREAEAIPDRWMTMDSLLTGQPYSELMELVDARVHGSDPQVVAIEFISQAPNRYIQLTQMRDLLPLIPVEG